MKALLPAGEERDPRFEGIRADIEKGRAGKVVRGPAPFRNRHGEVETCCRYFANNLDRTGYREFRKRGIQFGSGVMEAGCRTFGLPDGALRSTRVT